MRLQSAQLRSLPAAGGQPPIAETASLQLQGDAASTPLPGGALSLGASRRQLPRYPRSGHGLLYVADYYPSAIDIFSLTGPNQKQIGSITNGVKFPAGLSIDANNSLYVANEFTGSVNVYPYGSTTPSMTYSTMYTPLYALADSTGYVFVSGQNRRGRGYVVEFKAGYNRVIARQRLGSEADGMAEDGQGNLYVAYRGGGRFKKDSIAEFGRGLTNMHLLGMTLQQPQGLLVDNAGNIIVVESHAQRIDVFPPGSKTASVTVTIVGTSYLEGLAMQNSETTLWVSTWGIRVLDALPAHQEYGTK